MQLTLNDLAAVVQLIDVVTARGALRGDELTQVGTIRDRFAAFVQAAQENNDADAKADFEADAQSEE